MAMVYLRDKRGRTYAVPSHIIEDFEISNVTLGPDSERRPAEAAGQASAKMQALWESLEIDLSVSDLRSILGLGQRQPGLPSGLCAGLPRGGGGLRGGWGRPGPSGLCAGLPQIGGAGRRPGGGHTPGGGHPPGICGGLAPFDLGDAPWGRFFSDPRVQHIRLRLKATQLSSVLYDDD